MALYRLFPSTNGPGSPNAFAGNFLAGVVFNVTLGNCWFEGYYWWVPTGGDTTGQKFALWCLTTSDAGVLVPNSVVSSGTLTPNTWNYVPLPTPLNLAIGTTYCACTGWTAVNGFPITNNQFGSGQPFSAGITNGPLFAYSDQSGSAPAQYLMPQGVFSVAGNDPSVNMPNDGSNSANFWMDVSIADTQPVTFAGPYQIWPSKFDANQGTGADSAFNYIIGTEFQLSTPCYVDAISYFTPTHASSTLATRASVWSVAGQNEVAVIGTPSWSGAAGTGTWITASFTGSPLLAANTRYRVTVYNSQASPGQWSATDNVTDYWGTGVGKNGIINGPIYAPSLSNASLCWEYSPSLPGATPPYSTGVQEPGQCPFGQLPSGANTFPQLYVDGLGQNYWVDILVTPQQLPPSLPLTTTYMMRRV